MNSKVSTFKSFLAYNAILQGEKQLRQTMEPLLLRTHTVPVRAMKVGRVAQNTFLGGVG